MMTKKKEGSTRMPGFHLQKAEDKERFKEQVENLNIERKLRLIYAFYTSSLVQSDATVNFFAAKLGIVDQIVTVFKPENGPIVHDHYRFTRNDEGARLKCSANRGGCNTSIFIPKTAQVGHRFAIINRNPHNHSVSYFLNLHSISIRFRRQWISTTNLAAQFIEINCLRPLRCCAKPDVN
jgi:hypothetical protein